MIVVVGEPVHRVTRNGVTADGLPARVALSAAAHGRSVQFIGKAGEDPEGDEVVLALARGGVGHVALLRDAGLSTPRASRVADDDPEALADDVGTAGDTGATDSTGRGPVLDAADVELALRYLTDFTVIVVADPVAHEIVRVAGAAAGWADARLIVVVPAGEVEQADLPPDAIVFEAPDADPDGVFADLVGSFAAALDEGDDPAAAFQSSVASGGWTRAGVDQTVGD